MFIFPIPCLFTYNKITVIPTSNQYLVVQEKNIFKIIALKIVKHKKVEKGENVEFLLTFAMFSHG